MARSRPLLHTLMGSLVLGLVWTFGAGAASYSIVATKASSNEILDPPTLATDGISATHWACMVGSRSCWLRLDLGTVKSIDAVSIDWPGTIKYDFKVSVAGDDFNYKTVASGTSAGTSSNAETYAFAATPGRFVKITVTGNDANDGRAAITDVTVSRSISTSVWLCNAASIAGRLRSTKSRKSRVEMFPVLTNDSFHGRP